MQNRLDSADVIVLAGGSGKRMNQGINKVFIPLLDIPILFRTLLRFESISQINRIIPVIRKEDIETFQKLKQKYSLSKLIDPLPGGSERSDSVRIGLEYVQSNPEADSLLVHDGARPFFSHNLICNLIRNINDTNCVIPTTPVTETVRIQQKGERPEVINRNLLSLVQTPQAFSLKSVEECFLSHSQRKLNLTDDAAYFENLGYEVKQVEGEKWNIKITRPEDLTWAECLLEQYKEVLYLKEDRN